MKLDPAKSIIVRKPCCRVIIMACVKGYEDRQAKRDIAAYIQAGYSVETVETAGLSKDPLFLGKCKCEGKSV